MSQQIAEMVKKCESCRKESNVQQSPLLRFEFPSCPWEKLGSDLFYFDSKWFLLVVDYYSRFIKATLLEDLTISKVILHLKNIFARHGSQRS
ncbi:hypothetical protein EB796_008936 [Bugula neritina]|uniref:Integrase catalytic domain-containing protein n=1 Tax=Bugula neritina TaxID=10212 RepID=A0A7J7K288_BUGNE|nr:hypothetical protein EB796_008936 [Bugula neritina]